MESTLKEMIPYLDNLVKNEKTLTLDKVILAAFESIDTISLTMKFKDGKPFSMTISPEDFNKFRNDQTIQRGLKIGLQLLKLMIPRRGKIICQKKKT